MTACKHLVCGSSEHLCTSGYYYQYVSGYCKSYRLAVTCCSATPQAILPVMSAAKTQPESGSAFPPQDLEGKKGKGRAGKGCGGKWMGHGGKVGTGEGRVGGWGPTKPAQCCSLGQAKLLLSAGASKAGVCPGGRTTFLGNKYVWMARRGQGVFEKAVGCFKSFLLPLASSLLCFSHYDLAKKTGTDLGKSG